MTYIVLLTGHNDRMQGRLEKVVMPLLGALLIILMCSIVTQVVYSALDISPLLQFQSALTLPGNAITLKSLIDFQWHLLLITGLIPIGIVFPEVTYDRHRAVFK